MEAKRETAVVGFVVIVVAVLLFATILYLSGTLSSGLVPYRSYFKNAGGLSAGSEVRYGGGPRIGRIKKVAPDPKDPSRMEVEFVVNPDVPVKTDSLAKIESTSALGENFLGLHAGSDKAAKAPPNSILPSEEYISFADIGKMLNSLGPSAQDLINHLNDRVVELKETIYRVNDLLNDRNRENISSSISNIRGILDENRAPIKNTLAHVNDASAKIGPLLDNFKTTSAKANDLITHLDGVVQDPKVKESIAKLHATLTQANELMTKINNILDANSENLDEIVDNLRAVSDNMREFTETIKNRPYTLIRSSSPKAHEPGEPAPK